VTRLVLASAAALLLSGGVSPGWAATCDLGVPACCTADGDCDDTDVCSGTETCDLGTGTCLAGTPAADDDPCDDADACTTLDTCQGGACVGVFPVVCDDGDPCTDDVCDPATGFCLSPPGPDGAGCEDFDACTQTDTCQGGQCVGADPVVCDDADPCTADACDSSTGACLTPPAPDGTPCTDADACTQTDQCQAGLCVGADPVVCDDSDPCTADACDSGSGACLTPPAPDGTPCTDADACTQTDQCQNGLCVGFAPVACDDGFLCTDDVCDRDTGSCTFTGVDARCPDGACFDGACRTNDPDADTAGCVPLPAREDETCADEGVACTDDRCASGMCVHIPVDARCPPGDECAQATCAPADAGADPEGCLVGPGQPDGAPCTEDLDPCTRDLCRTGACSHEVVASLQACEPVADPFRQALVLAAFAVQIASEVDQAPTLSDTRRAGLLSPLEDVRAGLLAAAAELNGADPVADTAQSRAHRAFPHLRKLPKRAQIFVRLVRSAKKAGQLSPDEATSLKRSGKDLLRGVRTLKRDVRRLRKVTRVFQ
jgi:hypothetical protein